MTIMIKTKEETEIGGKMIMKPKMPIEKILKKIILSPKGQALNEKYLFALAKQYGKNILVCDTSIIGAIDWKRDGNFFYKKIGDVVVCNIDHHFPIKEFERIISTTNLVIDQIKNLSSRFDYEDCVVVINHTDCDALLSALVVLRILLPDKKFGDAAISADHTGNRNEIADLLQAMEYERNLDLSLRNLISFLESGDIEKKSQRLLDGRKEERKGAENIFAAGKIKHENGLYYITVEQRIDPAFFLSFLPQTEILAVFSPGKGGKIEARIRLGNSAKIDNLYELKISDFDEAFGCRWNAGSNERSGGSSRTEEEYVEYILVKLNK